VSVIVKIKNIESRDRISRAACEIFTDIEGMRRLGCRILGNEDGCHSSAVKVIPVIQALLICSERDVDIVVTTEPREVGDVG
jgi:hypothetical protein